MKLINRNVILLALVVGTITAQEPVNTLTRNQKIALGAAAGFTAVVVAFVAWHSVAGKKEEPEIVKSQSFEQSEKDAKSREDRLKISASVMRKITAPDLEDSINNARKAIQEADAVSSESADESGEENDVQVVSPITPADKRRVRRVSF
jgi:hypothetical protein